MTLKFELEQWQQACAAFDNGDYDMSIKSFINIADNAKMHFNIGLIFAAVDDHEHALGAFTRSLTMDPYFAVAYFQRGVSYFLQNNMEAARDDFDQAYQKLRGNQIINYHQLGLSFRLYACEILFNRGICQLYLGKIDAGLTDLYLAQKAKMTEEHNVIDQAVKDRGKGYSVFSIPPLVIFRPSENRLKQLQGVDVFAAIDQLVKSPSRANSYQSNNYNYHHISSQHIHHKSHSYINRKNSVLVNNIKNQLPALLHPPPSSPLPPTPSSITSNSNQFYHFSNGSMGSMRYSGSPTSLPPTPTNSTPTLKKRNDSNLYQSDDSSASTLSSFASSIYQYPRRVGSGIESDERYRNPSPPPPLPTDELYMKPTRSSSQNTKVKVKVHYTDTRILLVPISITFDQLKLRIMEKFDALSSIRLQYKDEDNEMVLMIDDDDLYMARQVHKDTSEFEKMEIWCV